MVLINIWNWVDAVLNQIPFPLNVNSMNQEFVGIGGEKGQIFLVEEHIGELLPSVSDNEIFPILHEKITQELNNH